MLAAVIRSSCPGAGLRAARDHALARLVREPEHHETLAAIESAQRASLSGPAPCSAEAIEAIEAIETIETIETIGAGGTGEEALAISLYCALVEPGASRAGNPPLPHDEDLAVVASVVPATEGTLARLRGAGQGCVRDLVRFRVR